MQIRGMGCCVMVEEIALILFIFQERTEADRIDSRYCKMKRFIFNGVHLGEQFTDIHPVVGCLFPGIVGSQYQRTIQVSIRPLLKRIK